MSDDPITPTMEGCIAVHEMFMSYVEAGFTVEQAMLLMIAHITAAGGAE